MIGSMIIDQHDALVAAWDKINDAAKTRGLTNSSMDAARAVLGAAPITQQQADAYGAKWQDQVFRNQQISAWRQFALGKYGNATTLATKAVSDAQSMAAAAAAQQQQLTYIGSGIIAIIVVAAGLYVTMKRRKEAAEVKK
jgi:hypothetical protein